MNKDSNIFGKLIQIPTQNLFPHKDNPRKNLGDLTELVSSIKESGIMQNLTVVPNSDTEATYTVIIGHRRLAAAKEAGLLTVPCVIVELTPQEQIATMLLENMQRSDLTAREQAEGIQMMLDLGESVESVSKKTGLSESTVRRRVSLMKLDKKKMDSAESRGVTLEQYIKASELKSASARNKVLDAAGTDNFNNELKKAQKEEQVKENKPKVLKELKAITTTEIGNFTPWGGSYDTVKKVDIADYKPGCFEIKKNNKKEYYYAIYWDTAYLLTKREKSSITRTKTDKEKEVMRLNRELRSEFIAQFSSGLKQADVLNEWLLALVFYSQVHYIENTNKDFLRKCIGQTEKLYSVDEKRLKEFFEKEPSRAKAVLVYAACGDKDEMGFYSQGRGEYYPNHQKNERLNLIYKYLCLLGYQMSDDEKKLQDGTHELFKRKDK